MRRNLSIILMTLFLIICVTGCYNGEIKVKGDRVVCTYSTSSGGIKTDSRVTIKFNKDNYVNYELSEQH